MKDLFYDVFELFLICCATFVMITVISFVVKMVF